MLRHIALLLFLSIGGAACSAQSPQGRVTASSRSADEIQATIMGEVQPEALSLMARHGYRSLSGAIVYQGRIYTFHFGRLSSGKAPEDGTLYEIGSVTKTFTGLLLARAVRDGKVDLDVPVSQYLPEREASHLIRNGKAVTLRHLATHMSGLPHQLACDDVDLTTPARIQCLAAHDDRNFLARLADVRLGSDPGDAYLYSNTGARLIGLVLERVYGARLADLFQRFILEPARIAAGCGAPENSARLAARENVGRTCDGAGGLVASTPDMGRYLAVYLNGDDLAVQATTPLLQQGQWGRAYLWNTYRPDTEGQLYHAGGTFNTSSWVSIYPREGLGVFLVTPDASESVQGTLNESANAIVARLRMSQIPHTDAESRLGSAAVSSGRAKGTP